MVSGCSQHQFCLIMIVNIEKLGFLEKPTIRNSSLPTWHVMQLGLVTSFRWQTSVWFLCCALSKYHLCCWTFQQSRLCRRRSLKDINDHVMCRSNRMLQVVKHTSKIKPAWRGERGKGAEGCGCTLPRSPPDWIARRKKARKSQSMIVYWSQY